jgi:hypothetical protein
MYPRIHWKLVEDTLGSNEHIMGTTGLGVGARGAAVVEALHYKPEGLGIESRWFNWNFHLRNPSGRTMALGSTQPLTEMNTRNISWG